ncbi:MAG: hydroxymethylglutaryl-CoA lyase [Gammaproteobacteria bacterium]|nr:hydroxymethylglutaryl-CoA lyase [Gammaproteobacteria bacterium]
MNIPRRVNIVEVGPRDGLQNEKTVLTPAQRADLAMRLAGCGLRRIEAGSFVAEKMVPQMAGSAEVFARLKNNSARFSALVPNMRGLEDALRAGVGEVAVFAAASETFSQKNINCSITESIQRFTQVARAAHDNGAAVRGYISCIAGCPYEGGVKTATVADLAARLVDIGCGEVSLGDTIGVGTVPVVQEAVYAAAKMVDASQLAVHFHDTRGQALVNIRAALEAGVATVDSAVAGLGGCPFAPGAAGNAATEDVVYMLHGMDVATGVDLHPLVDTAWHVSRLLKRAPASRTAHAMAAPTHAGTVQT